jgi:hypothetical protein
MQVVQFDCATRTNVNANNSRWYMAPGDNPIEAVV